MKGFFSFAILIGSALSASAAPTKLAFERNDTVWVANIDGTDAKKIANGASPALSPDATRLAFDTQQAIGQPAHRKIGIADLASGSVAIFNDVPSDNCLQPVWSPDGARLLFYLYINNQMRIGVVNADGTGFRFIDKDDATHHGYWSATWAHDGQSIYGQDMANLYQLSLEATVMKKWTIEKLIPRGGMNGNVRLNVSPDGKTLLLDVEMDEKERKDWDGPPPAIWTVDFATEKVTRLTPKTLYGWDSCWCGNDAIVFDSQTASEKNASVYRMSLGSNGKDKKLLVKDARLPSVAP
jgi:TolB protein